MTEIATANGVIDSIPVTNEALWSIYPEHIYDETRRSIATQILGKEVAKLTQVTGNEELEASREMVGTWFDGVDLTLTPVHDFWSLFDGITAVKTKRLCQFITAQNVEWTQETREVLDIQLTWMPFLEASEGTFGKSPWNLVEVKGKFSEDPELHDEALEVNLINIAQYRFEHSKEPIILVQTEDDTYFLDGNGRLYRAFMAGEDKINCWVGQMSGERPENFWIGAGRIKDLCYEITNNQESDPEVSDAALILLNSWLDNNVVARVNYNLWVRRHFPNLDSQIHI